MNYKIGDKVNISLTAPLIVTDIDKHLDRIKVSSENGDIYFWASPKFFTPHTPPPTSPHKSLNIGDLIITKPTATPYHYEAAIGNHIGVIKNNAVNEDCYLVQWIYNISTHQKLEPSINAVHIDQFAHIYTPPPRPTTSKKCIPQLGDIVVAASGTCSKGYVNISNLVGCIIKEDRHGTTVEWIEPLYEEWPSNIVNPDDLTIIYRPP
jgi:hypothetical protein